MFRLRYPSGEEAIFRSVEELALGLRSGIIGTETYVLDNTAHVWQPLAQHPIYQEATSLAATLNSYGDLELEPAPAAAVTASGRHRAVEAARPVYQMASISGGELAARRQQKMLIKAGIVAAAVLIVATSGFMIWRERNRMGDPGDNHVQLVSEPPTGGRPATPPPSGAYWLSPGILASRREESQARIDRALIDSSTHLWWEDLITLERLRSADSVRIELDRLRRWRKLSSDYRNNSFAMLKVYQDTANIQVRNDQWSLLDVNDWRSRSAFVEGPADAMKVDSLLGGLQKLYELLLAQNGDYQLRPDRAEFTTHRARIEYQRLSGIIRRYGGAAPPSERVSLPLSMLRQALDGPPLPPVPAEPDDP